MGGHSATMGEHGASMGGHSATMGGQWAHVGMQGHRALSISTVESKVRGDSD